jgi:hypothetical protein
MNSLTVAFLTAAAVSLFTPHLFANDSDGAYGRVHSDLALQLDLGALAQQHDNSGQVSLVARYLQTAGLYASFVDKLSDRPGNLYRSTSAGIELRPLFLPRFLRNYEQGPSLLDLSVDSLALRAGAIFGARPFAEPKRPGFEIILSMGLPLSAKAGGPWLTIGSGVRISSAPPVDDQSRKFSDMLFLSASLGWQTFFDMGIVDIADRSLK